MKRIVMVGVMAWAGACTGCENSPACEQARTASAAAWQEVKTNAAARQVSPRSRGAQVSEQQLVREHEAWLAFEKQAELLHSSFQTQQITWRPAEKARAALLESFAAYESGNTDGFVTGFRQLLDEAVSKQAEADQACR